MKIQSRVYNKDSDFDLIMNFLAHLWEKTKSYENWFPIRFENSIDTREDGVRMWEEIDKSKSPPEKKIVALTTCESPRDFFLHVDPNYRSLEQEMIEWIEYHFREINKGEKGEKILKINIFEGNNQREALLTELGFIKEKVYGYYRIREGNAPITDHQCPENFEIRTIKRSEFNQLALLIQKVFGYGDWFTADVLEQITTCSFYQQDLDLVSITSEGIIASFCTFRRDSYSKIMLLEPMGTNPNFRNLGLGKALITEGIKRSKKYNPPLFCIDGAANTPAANRLYDATGFTKKYAIYSWVKKFLPI